jgi:hypothetical protein
MTEPAPLTDPTWPQSITLDYDIPDHAYLTLEFSEDDREIFAITRAQALKLNQQIADYLLNREPKA